MVEIYYCKRYRSPGTGTGAGRQAGHPAQASRLAGWLPVGRRAGQPAALAAIAASALLMIAVVPPHCLGYCYTTIRYGKIWGARGRE